MDDYLIEAQCDEFIDEFHQDIIDDMIYIDQNSGYVSGVILMEENQS